MVHQRYAGKVATVTGAASGIGEAVARRLVGEGAQIVAADINSEGLERLAFDLGDACVAITTDVTLETQVEVMVRTAKERFGKFDAGFNVAGSARMAPIVEQSEADFRFAIDLCVIGTFLCIKHQARQMIADGVKGAIVNVSSLNARVPCWGLGAYAAAKAGVEMLGNGAALELADHGIRVNAVAPGMTTTPATGYMDAGIRNAYLERIPLKRPASVDDQASACLFLGSDEASYITGVSLYVDGGWQHSAYPDMRTHFSRTPDSLT